MKKLINKVRLKNVLIIWLILIMLFQFMIPNVAFAAYADMHEWEMTYNDWIKEQENWSGKEDRKKAITDASITYIKARYYSAYGTDEAAKKLLNDYGDSVKIKGTLTPAERGKKASFKVSSIIIEDMAIDAVSGTESMTYSEFVEYAKTWKSEEEIKDEVILKIKLQYFNNEDVWREGGADSAQRAAEEMFESRKNSIIIAVIKKDIGYKIKTIYDEDADLNDLVPEIVSKVVDEDENVDVGGILLKPLFALVNVVADSIMSITEGIMTGQGFLGSIWPDLLRGNEIKEEFPEGANYIGEIESTEISPECPSINYSPEEIFAGKIEMLSIDFISPMDSDNPLSGIRNTIASWYKALRLFAVVGLLSVLIYTGIKIIISSSSKDKAKYKEWIMNWVIAFAILFAMHYIMSFIILTTNEINGLLAESTGKIRAEITVNDGDKQRFETNLIGLVRYMIQGDSFTLKIGYEVMYIALIVYTLKFTFVYLKRVLNMAFLTLIAPIVALTYPIDKMTDGSAQGFDMWLKEYIFNALLQPMHYLLYFILVSSAIEVTATNPIYGIVVLAFMTEAERLLKKIFGFDKASGGTVGGMANAFAAGAIASKLSSTMKSLGKGGGKGGNAGKSDAGGELPPKRKDFDTEKELGLGAGDPGAGGDQNDENRPESEDNKNSEVNPEVKPSLGVSRNPQAVVSPVTKKSQDPITAQKSGDKSGSNAKPAGNNGPDNGESIRSKAKKLAGKAAKTKVGAGVTNLGKKIAKPVWDFNNDAAYNGRRYLRRLKKAPGKIFGAGVGITAAAVQAGISITDGKYNPLEGIASFGAGYAVGNKFASNVGSTFMEGYNSAEDKAVVEEHARNEYFDNWLERDDVNKVFKDKFGDNYQKMKAQAKEYTDMGYTDPKQVAKLMKTTRELQAKYPNWTDRTTIAAMNFNQELKEQSATGTLTDLGKRKKYIDSIIERKGLNVTGKEAEAEKLRATYKNMFSNVGKVNDKLSNL